MTTSTLGLSVRVTEDRLNRTVVVLDDATAMQLACLARLGWLEIADANMGYSAKVLDGTPEALTIQLVLDALVLHFEARFWTTCDFNDLRDLERARRGSFYGSLVGSGDWNEQAQWWRDRPANLHLHVGGSLVRNQGGWRFEG